MGADRRPHNRSRIKAVPLASLPMPQRRLVSALLEAAKAAAIGRAVAADTKIAESELGREADIHAMARTARPVDRAAELHARANELRLRRERLR